MTSPCATSRRDKTTATPKRTNRNSLSLFAMATELAHATFIPSPQTQLPAPSNNIQSYLQTKESAIRQREADMLEKEIQLNKRELELNQRSLALKERELELLRKKSTKQTRIEPVLGEAQPQAIGAIADSSAAATQPRVSSPPQPQQQTPAAMESPADAQSSASAAPIEPIAAPATSQSSSQGIPSQSAQRRTPQMYGHHWDPRRGSISDDPRRSSVDQSRRGSIASGGAPKTSDAQPAAAQRTERVELQPKAKHKKHAHELYTKDEDLEKLKGFARKHGCIIS